MVVTQLVERSLSIPEIRGSNPVTGKFYCIETTKMKKKMSEIAQFLKQNNLIYCNSKFSLIASRGETNSKAGSGCGSVGRVVASTTRGLLFESSHWDILCVHSVNCIEKTNMKKHVQRYSVRWRKRYQMQYRSNYISSISYFQTLPENANACVNRPQWFESDCRTPCSKRRPNCSKKDILFDSLFFLSFQWRSRDWLFPYLESTSQNSDTVSLRFETISCFIWTLLDGCWHM